jgi:hypothetical protein
MAQLQATISRTMIEVSQRASPSTPRRRRIVNSLTLKKLPPVTWDANLEETRLFWPNDRINQAVGSLRRVIPASST